MGASYAVGSFLPIVAFILPLSMPVSTLVSLVLAVAGLFSVGYYAATMSDRNPILKGLEIVAFGCAVFAISYLAGHYIPPLFGHSPISV
jgi:VIT1/CCC1 family predicted Fe2+/Mn2+ transporter